MSSNKIAISQHASGSRIPSALAPRIQSLFRNKKPQIESIRDAAREVHKVVFEPKTPRKMLVEHFELGQEIDAINFKISGRNASPAAMETQNLMINFLAELLVNEVPINDAFITQLQDLEAEYARAGQNDIIGQWRYGKLLQIKEMAENKYMTAYYAFMLSIPHAQRLASSLRMQFSDLRAVNESILNMIRLLRQFGVKSCFFADGITTPAGRYWLFSDPKIELRRTDGLDGSDFMSFLNSTIGALVLIALSHRPRLGEKPLVFSSERTDGGGSRTHMHTGVPSDVAWYMRAQDGELDMLSYGASGALSVRKVFKEAGKETEYELLRLAHLMRLFDLTVPIERVRKYPPLPRARMHYGVARYLMPSILPALISPTIILPRVKYIEDERRAFTETETESNRDKDHTISVRNPNAPHLVSGHLRRLPPNYKPSEQARELAWEEQGINLSPDSGYTYVKTHEQGKLNSIPQAVRTIPGPGSL